MQTFLQVDKLLYSFIHFDCRSFWPWILFASKKGTKKTPVVLLELRSYHRMNCTVDNTHLLQRYESNGRYGKINDMEGVCIFLLVMVNET